MMPLWQARVIKIVARVAGHPNPRHHSPRPRVCRARKRHDLLKAGRSEPEREARKACLGCIAAPPRGSREAPSDLDCRGEVRLERRHVQASEAQELAGRSQLESPEPVTAPIKFSFDLGDQSVAISPLETRRKVLHHARISVEQCKGLA